MKYTHLLGALLILGVLALVTANVLADATMYVSPKKIPTDGKVEIRVVGDAGTNTLNKIYVEGPDGTVYVYGSPPYGIDISGGGEYTVEFGTGVAGWTPAASTGLAGQYHVVAEGVNAEGFFDCSREFSVPEFAIAAGVITVLGFAALTLARRRFIKP